MAEAPRFPLTGMRVVDLSTEIAGPYATKLLADAGADVIKVEAPDGDPLRRWSASHTAIPAGADGALFQFLNASKRGIVADLGSADGHALVVDLAARADVLVDSFGPGGLASRGLGYDALRARNHGLSVVSISPFGQTGPWAYRPATEWTLQAAVGSTAYRGLPARGPVAVGGRLGEWVTGIHAALGALFAWISARSGGVGQFVDLSMFEAMIWYFTIYGDLSAQLRGGDLPQYVEVPAIEPAKDGWVGFNTVTGQQWADFCALIGRPDLTEDEGFFNQTIRSERLAFLQPAIHAWTRAHTVAEIVELATALRVPAIPVGNGQTVLTMEHFVARGVFVENPAGFRQPRVPYRLEKNPPRPFARAPRLDEHAAAIRAEIGTTPVRPRRTLRTPKLPLAALRVVDLTAFWAGPCATVILAAMGADVVKVESIQRPDGMRFASGNLGERYWERGAVFLGANVGKRGVTLRLDRPEGLALFKRLLENADVVAENFSARVMDHFGLGWETVREINPRLIMLRMPAYGLDGPWRDRPGFAGTVEEVSGLSWMTGYEDLPLLTRTCDPTGGMHAVVALLVALEHRRATGEGQLVEVPLVEPGLNVAAEQVIEYSAYGQLLSCTGNRGPYAAPQGVYPCMGSQEYVALAVVTDEHWRALCAVLGTAEWARDARLSDAAGRRACHDEIDGGLRAWLATQRRDGALERMLAAGIPAAAAINPHALMPNPQLEHRRFFQVLDHPYVGSRRYPGLPMRFSALGPDWYGSAAPTLGQHNDEILGGELGLSAAELARLRQDEIIGDRPSFETKAAAVDAQAGRR
ncbi:MAG: CoA transferase [Candidatus Binatia bacterium]